MRDRWRRAAANGHRSSFRYEILPSTLAGAISIVVALEIRDKGASVESIVIPGLAGLAAFVVILYSLRVLEFGYRLVTGRTPRGAPRTLIGLQTGRLRRALSRGSSMPIGVWRQGVSAESERFSEELQQLLTECGWHIAPGSSFIQASELRDVHIELPDSGFPQLLILGNFLERHQVPVTYALNHGTRACINVYEQA